jgi:hypothetical protein
MTKAAIRASGLPSLLLLAGFSFLLAIGCTKDEAPETTKAALGVEAKGARRSKPRKPKTHERALPSLDDHAGADEAGARGTDAEVETEGGGGSAGADTKAEEQDPVPGLLKEAKSRRTKDDRALAALDEAEKAGASPTDLAKAANARGLALHASPDRARKFFEWAAEKDPKYADPVFNIAKQFAMLGDVPMVKEYLTKTRERGGKRLLRQIEFDPMWEIVKDDPEVRKLLK